MTHCIAPDAEAELDSIWLYIAKRSGSMDIADRLIDSITARFCLLAQNPFLGRSRDYDLRPGLRSFAVGNYVIIYRPENEDVLILHVVHGNQNIQALFT
jgi:toxin ParE1/3/4